MRLKTFSFSTILFFSPLVISAEQFPLSGDKQIFQPVYAQHGMVASQEQIASKIGVQILRQGGNAVDAAVAVGYALAVTLPKAGNLGGGGFMIIWMNHEKKSIVINYREKAPKLASRNMFLDAKGNVNEDSITKSYKAVGVPGTVYGLNLALKKYGTMPLSKVIAPAISLARDGIIVTHALSNSLQQEKNILSSSEETKKIFFNKNNEPFQPGDILFQKDLAKTLTLIAKQGSNVFYKGEIAKKIVSDIQSHGGLISLQDFSQYKAEELMPVINEYRGYKIYSVPPPSSGGVTLVEMLNILEHFDLSKIPYGSAKYYHLLSEIMNHAYFDRNNHLGDPDFVNNPIEKLTSKQYAKLIAEKINLEVHTPSIQIQSEGTPIEANQKLNTTHFSVADKDGNMVSNTYTLNYYYGNGKTAKGTGILLNNEMDDFTAKPGEANSFGLVQGEKNAIAPEKRPLSSMTPTLVLNQHNEPFLALGAPGGSRITTQIFLMLTNIIDYHKNIQTASSQPRFHSQLWPDKFFYEEGISPDTLEMLKKRGHTVEMVSPYGSTQAIEIIDNKNYQGSSDPRSEGDGAVGL